MNLNISEGSTSQFARRKREKSYEKDLAKTSQGIAMLKKMLDPRMAKERENARFEARKVHNDIFGKFDIQNKQAHSKLFEILWYTQLPCFDIRDITLKVNDHTAMLKRCYWKGVKMSCSAIFKTQPTDRGMCCSFNMEVAEKVYKESR